MLYQEKIMKFLDNWEQSELDLKEKKYTENHLTNAFVGGVIAGVLVVTLSQATLNFIKANQDQQTEQTTVKGKDR